MANIGELATIVTANTAPFRRAMRSARSSTKSFVSGVRNDMRRLGRALTSIPGLAAVGGGVGLLGWSAKLAMNLEESEIQFRTFLRSAEKAKNLMAELKKFSDVTPFTSSEVRAAGRNLLAFGFAADDVVPTLQLLGDAAAGTGSNVNDLVNILGKIRSKGVLQMEEANRFVERGINIMPELAKNLGVTNRQLSEMVSKGQIGFDAVTKSLRNLNSEGGLFFGSMEALSQGTPGVLSTLRSAFEGVGERVGQALLQGIKAKDLASRLTDLARDYEVSIVDATVGGVERMMQAIRWAEGIWIQMQTGWNKMEAILTKILIQYAKLGQAVNIGTGDLPYVQMEQEGIEALAEMEQRDAQLQQRMANYLDRKNNREAGHLRVRTAEEQLELLRGILNNTKGTEDAVREEAPEVVPSL